MAKKEKKIKIFFPFCSYPTGNRKFQKKRKKKLKNQKIPWWFNSKPKQVGKGRGMEKIKIAVPFRSHSTRSIKFQKNQQKNEKNDKNPLWRHFQPKQVGKG